MVHFITGRINQGKSTKLVSIYCGHRLGDGFYNRKVYINDSYVGQEIVRLSTGESVCLSYKEGFIPMEWDEECRLNVYSFSKKGLNFAELIIEDMIVNRIEPVFIDEIGPLELQGNGLNEAFTRLLKEKKELYVVVRESCLQDVINKYGITGFEIVP